MALAFKRVIPALFLGIWVGAWAVYGFSGQGLLLGVLDGLPGLIIAVTTAYGVFAKYAKLWEIEFNAKKSIRPQTMPCFSSLSLTTASRDDLPNLRGDITTMDCPPIRLSIMSCRSFSRLQKCLSVTIFPKRKGFGTIASKINYTVIPYCLLHTKDMFSTYY